MVYTLTRKDESDKRATLQEIIKVADEVLKETEITDPDVSIAITITGGVASLWEVERKRSTRYLDELINIFSCDRIMLVNGYHRPRIRSKDNM